VAVAAIVVTAAIAVAAAAVGSATYFSPRTLIFGSSGSTGDHRRPAKLTPQHILRQDGAPIYWRSKRMLRWFQRPKLDARFTATHALSDEFARTIEVAGELTLRNDGSDAEVDDVEMMVIAGFRRIPLEVPGEWRALQIESGAAKSGAVRWSLTLDAPLRAETGELYVSARDHKRKKWEWRLPFAFERR
jgi:hypothetical protein